MITGISKKEKMEMSQANNFLSYKNASDISHCQNMLLVYDVKLTIVSNRTSDKGT